MAPPRLVIFDCDGVLVDTEATHCRMLSRNLARHGLTISPEDCMARFLGSRMATIGETATRIGATLPEDWIDEAYGEIFAELAKGVPVIDGISEVLDILERHRARASFFCIGARAEAHPALVEEIVRRGHRIENHSQHHRHDFSLLGPWRMRAEILAAQHSLQRTAGRPPRYFRAPAGLRNPFLEPVLAALGLHLASWTRRGFDTRSGDPDRVLARLLRRLAAGDILLLHDGHAARDAGSGRPVILTVLPRLLAALDAAGLAAVPLPDAPPGERRSRP